MARPRSQSSPRQPRGSLYLVHFGRPIGSRRHQAQHYIGWAQDVDARIGEHLAGRGARILAYVASQDIAVVTYVLATGATRADERRVKRHRHHAHYCPLCSPRPRRPTGQGLKPKTYARAA
jgi:predicted GIY-YIG superfamily endonuclease